MRERILTEMSLVREKRPPSLRLPRASSAPAAQPLSLPLPLSFEQQQQQQHQQQRGLYLSRSTTEQEIEKNGGWRLPQAPVESNEGDLDLRLEDLERKQILGQGSGGKVYKVIHKKTNNEYALKTIHAKANAEELQQARREMEITRRSNSPAVVQCYRVFESGGDICLLLEYMDGGTLAHILKNHKKIKEPYLARITRQVLNGLVYLHRSKIVHRDIKPSNLLLNKRGDVKIADFGVSTRLASTIAQCQSFVGTCAYMSPERFETDKGFNSSADIWSLGVVLLECCLGKYPFLMHGQRADWITLMCNICQSHPTSSSSSSAFIMPWPSPSQASSEFTDFISLCINKDPSLRPRALELLHHPFLKKYESIPCSLLPLIS